MATGRDYDIEGRGLIPPYGPSRGMLQALHLLRRTTPTRIDSDYLRVNKIAPGNEYKVVGALRFLELIRRGWQAHREQPPAEDQRGHLYPGPAGDSPQSLLRGISTGCGPNGITREGIYNHFVTEGGIGAEMATKATRFLIKLCRLAEIELAPESPRGASRGKRKAKAQPQHYIKSQAEPGARGFDLQSPTQVGLRSIPHGAGPDAGNGVHERGATDRAVPQDEDSPGAVLPQQKLIAPQRPQS